MGSLALPFVIVPGMAAVIMAYVIADWRIAAAAVAGAGSMIMAVLSGLVPCPFFTQLPAAVGVGMAGLVLLPILYFRPGTDRWMRMTVSLAASLAAGLWLLFSIGEGA